MSRTPPTAAALATLILLAQPGSLAQPSPDVRRSPRNVNYQLAAKLDPATHSIQGSGRIIWRNITKAPTSELRFHLYWNAWRDANSSWMREQRLGRNARLASRPPGDWGGIDVTSLEINGTSLLSRASFIAPDDGNADDRTVWTLPLDQPVPPGEAVAVDIAWKARVPRTFARTGRTGDYYFIAQWFPKLGVLEESGWNCHQFHASTEFFSDFGYYDVSLTVPAGWTVGATGRLYTTLPAGDGWTTHQFLQQDVHDFAWTTSPDFVERRELFEHPGLPPVEMRLLLQPEHDAQASRHFQATREALRYYGEWFGPYPYGHITIVDPVTIFNPAAQGESTGGMEYPTLFTAGTRWFAPAAGTQPDAVTVHEAGHQFWYGIVATNEFEHAWMDEGINTYSTARVLAETKRWFVTTERYFGGLAGWPYPDAPWSRDIDGNRLNAYRPVAGYDRPSTPTWRYWPGSAGAMSYNKTSLWLATLERHLGWPTVQKILATHFARGAFRHPTPAEFFAIANEVSGQDLTWFFDQVYRSAATFDYAVSQVTSTPIAGATGGQFDDVVIARRLGNGIFPMSVRVTFADGRNVTETWDGRDEWRAFTYRGSARVAKVQIDPERVLLLDLNYTNNSWMRAPAARVAAWKWSLRWLTWLEELMLTYAFFV